VLLSGRSEHKNGWRNVRNPAVKFSE